LSTGSVGGLDNLLVGVPQAWVGAQTRSACRVVLDARRRSMLAGGILGGFARAM